MTETHSPQRQTAEPDDGQRTGAIVLTGGRSSRMGVDKASLVVDGMSMLDRVRAVLSANSIDDIVIAGPGHVADAIAENGPEHAQGPMAGIVGAWRALRSGDGQPPDTVVVLACDLPAIAPGVVGELVSLAPCHRHGATAHDGEHLQPLIAAYRAEALDDIERAFDLGRRSVRGCLGTWDLGVVRHETGEFSDADTPEDLQAFAVEWPS